MTRTPAAAVRPEHFVAAAFYAAWVAGTPMHRADGARRGRGAPSRRVRDRVLARDGYRCACGAPATTVDHFPVPWICGGSASPHNLRAACARCNSAAGAHGVVATAPVTEAFAW